MLNRKGGAQAPSVQYLPPFRHASEVAQVMVGRTCITCISKSGHACRSEPKKCKEALCPVYVEWATGKRLD